MPSDIILIGPERAGKSTVGKLLAARLEQPFTDLSGEIAHKYFAEQGHDWEAARRAWSEGGFDAFLRYQWPFTIYAVERGLQEHSGVIELGALQIALDDEALRERLRMALLPYPHVVLLLPSPDAEESIRTLDQRGLIMYDGVELTEHFVRHHSNHDLAKIRVYTRGQTPQESCAAIIAQLDLSSQEVLLIGPMGTGKSTLGALLAAQLGRPQVSLDAIRWEYYREIGYDRAVQDEINEREGFAGVYRYWKRFEAHAVERALQDHHGCVIDFGAGHSMQEDATAFARLQAILAPYPNVVLILPSPDLDESVAVLQERNTPKMGTVPLIRYQVTHPAYRSLATHVVYTQGHTPAELSDAIAALVAKD